jgi:hypothetical protein
MRPAAIELLIALIPGHIVLVQICSGACARLISQPSCRMDGDGLHAASVEKALPMCLYKSMLAAFERGYLANEVMGEMN